MRFRFFFLGVQSKFEHAYKKRTLESSLVITGGVGDFLQCIPYILRNPSNDYVVITHFQKAKEFFAALGIKTNEINTFSNLAEEALINKKVFKPSKIYKCPRDLFFEQNPLINADAIFNAPKTSTIGVHMSGSNFAVTHELNRGLTPKALSHSFTKLLLDRLEKLDVNVIFFGTKKEVSELGIKEHQKLRIACDDEIIKNLSSVSQCNAFIGSDSAFKTMSSMLRIPTILLYSKEKNNFRDRMFISPYVKERVVYPFKYKDFSESEVNRMMAFIETTLPKLLS